MTYNGETAILKLHLSVMSPYVDKFLIVEANKTFSGEDKPLYFFRDQRYFKEWWNKIEYYVVNDWDDPELWEMAINSPNTQGASHWKREFYIKESIKKALLKLNLDDEDTVLIGDVDEMLDLTNPLLVPQPTKAKLRVYAYHLNNLSSEEFWGTLIAQYKDVKDVCLNHLRSDKSLYSLGAPLGWHFTSMGGEAEVRRKLDNSYTAESYNTYEVQQLLNARMKAGTDYLGRAFTFTKDETHWPQFLKDNRDKFKALIR